VFFAADRRQTEAGNLAKFINLARNELTVFGSDLNWDADYWKSAGVTFANLDQKSRSYNSNNSLNPSFRDFAKAYYRYQQGHRPTKNTIIVIMLRCLRSHDPALSLHPSLTEISEQIAVKIPMTQQEFNTLSMPTAHIPSARVLASACAKISERARFAGRCSVFVSVPSSRNFAGPDFTASSGLFQSDLYSCL
jgi:hypothetical protein